jgi:hypothetical protein
MERVDNRAGHKLASNESNEQDAGKAELIDELLLSSVVGGLCFDDLAACTPNVIPIGPRPPIGPIGGGFPGGGHG